MGNSDKKICHGVCKKVCLLVICDDLKRKLQQMGHENPTEEQIYDYGLYLIDLDLQKKGKSLEQCPPMPLPVGNWAQIHGNCLIAEQLAYDRAEQREKVQQRLNQVNESNVQHMMLL